MKARRRWLRHAVMVVSGFLPALLVLPVAAELIQGERSPLREARHGGWVSSVELAGEPRRAARQRRPRRPVAEAPPRVYLGESPRGGPHQASDEAVVLHPPRQPLEQYLPMVKLAPVYPREAASPHFSPGAVMIAEDFGRVRVLATESIAGPTVEGACARTGPKDPRGRGQRSPYLARSLRIVLNCLKPKSLLTPTSGLVRNAG